MNFCNLPNWHVQALQENEDGYVVLAQPLTACSVCPTCGSTMLVKNGRDDSCVHDLPTQGKQVVIQVKRQRYLCKECHASCSQPLLDVDEWRNITRRLMDYIQRKSISTRRTFISIARSDWS